MLQFLQHFYRKAGKRPGVLAEKVDESRDPVRMFVTTLKKDRVTESELLLKDLDALPLQQGEFLWLRVIGVHDPEALQRIGEHFQMDNMLLEDIENKGHRPKIERHDKFLFLITKWILPGFGSAMTPGHMALILGDGWLLTFEDREADVIDVVRERIRTRPQIYIERGLDYLLYVLLDAVIDISFGHMDGVGTKLDGLEKMMENRVTREALLEAYRLRQELIVVRRWMTPLRDILSQLRSEECVRIGLVTKGYLRDTQDHCEQLIDAAEVYDEMVEAMISTHISASGQRSTEVMQTLTVIATIFIPLTFLVGIYGMNFDVMPELHLRWGYYAVWGIMLVLVGGMVAMFRRRGWF